MLTKNLWKTIHRHHPEKYLVSALDTGYYTSINIGYVRMGYLNHLISLAWLLHANDGWQMLIIIVGDAGRDNEYTQCRY